MLDFTKSRERCAHSYVHRGKIEVCPSCRTEFPCHGCRCLHLDCIIRGIELGRRGFPRNFPFSVSVLNDHHSGPEDDCAACSVDPDNHYYLRTTSDAPETWTLPVGWRLQ